MASLALRTLVAVLAGIVMLLVLATPAFAGDEDEGSGGGIIAIHIEGPKARAVRNTILDIVPDGVEVMGQEPFNKALQRSGLRGRMGHSISSKSARRMLLKVLKKAIANAELNGAIVGRVRAGRRGLELVVFYLDDENELQVDEAVPLKGDEEKDREALNEALGSTLEMLAPEPEPEEEQEEEEPEAEEKQEEEKEEDEPGDFVANQRGSELFSLKLGFEFGGRYFSYSESDVNRGNMRPYEVFGVPGIVIGGEVYPMATLGMTVLSDLGLTLSYMHAFGLSSETTDGRNFGTSFNRFRLGVRYRYRFGDADKHPIVLGLDAKYGFINFTFEPDGATAALLVNQLADVEYQFLRLGVDARVPIGDMFSVTPSIGYVGPLEGGPVYDRFTEPSLAGMDFGLLLALALGGGFEARAAVDYVQFGSSFEPEPNDHFVAGGALDQFISLRFAAAYVY